MQKEEYITAVQTIKSHLFLKEYNVYEEFSKVLPLIQEQIIRTLENEKNEEIQREILEILNHCLTGIEKRDKVILFDVLAYEMEALIPFLFTEDGKV